MRYVLTHERVDDLARRAAEAIRQHHGHLVTAYPVPRGGVPAAYLIQKYMPGIFLTHDPDQADVFIDDIIDSGATMQYWLDRYPHAGFFALVNKLEGNPDDLVDSWIVFPWEGDAEKSVADNIVRLLQYIGEDPNRPGLLETPHRVAKAWADWTAGYGQDPASILKVFEDGAEECDEMVVVRDIPFYSHCEHHLAPFFGTADIAYIPNGRIVGLSKLSRLLDVFARRLQVQERLTSQVAGALWEHLQPKGVGVTLKARHLCMESRGINRQGHHTVTSALRGVFKEDARVRAEFQNLTR